MIDIALLIVFPALMAYAAASDLFTMSIPNALSLALIGAFGVFALLAGLPPAVVLLHVAACALVLAVCFGLFAFGWIGGGDAKLASATALWFGFGALLDYLFLATIAGGALTLLILAARARPLPAFALGCGWVERLHRRDAGVPYGIALAGAALAVYPQAPIWSALLAR
jgi:prepilin peptidase CpaA